MAEIQPTAHQVETLRLALGFRDNAGGLYPMNSEQLAAYERLESIPERAQFLLDIGVSAKLDIDTEELEPVYRACVGDVRLHITAYAETTAIAKGTAWLEEKAEDCKGEATA